jgi:heat shock transcription factor
MAAAEAAAAVGKQQQKGGGGRGGGGGGPAPFLTKTNQMVEESATDEVISWGKEGRSFVVWKPVEFARDLLPLHFKHCNFSSFVRQLNTYVRTHYTHSISCSISILDLLTLLI